MPSVYSTSCLENVAETIDGLHAYKMFSLDCGYNPELIKQFYATLYVTCDPENSKTWKFDYMIQGQVFHMTVDQFLAIINLPRFEGLPHKLHDLPAPTPAEFSTIMNPDVVGDNYPTEPKPRHLVFEAKAWFYILSKTLMPMLDVHDNFPIPNDVQLALLKLVHGHPFDFEDYFLRTLVSCADDHNSHKPYAPWLMAICNYSRDVPFPISIYPKIFTPPVCKVLQVVARPNDPFAEHTGIRAHLTERNIRSKFIKPVHHMEVSLRSQQMLQHHIDQDFIQKQALMDEIKHLHNIAMNNNQMLRECLRRDWKGLRKFNSLGQLQRCGFEEYPPHLNRNWTNDDRVDRPDPNIPRLPNNRDVLSVDDYYHITVNTFSSDSEKDEAPQSQARVYSPLPRSPRTPPESQLESSRDHHFFRTKLTPPGACPIVVLQRSPNLLVVAETAKASRSFDPILSTFCAL